ncbi:MAG: DNA methyltransferase, partial [Lachnospiraceae bacterium]|nr:DNA methyltransferase [Lachnospiraceae bacterium]
GVVIGDKYQGGELIPLGFYTLMLFKKKGFLLKSIIVKNFGETKGKAGTQGIWRYRALANDFYIFRHEYILIFKKA